MAPGCFQQLRGLCSKLWVPFSYMEVSQNYGYPFGGSHSRDRSILGSMSGSLSLRETTIYTHATCDCGVSDYQAARSVAPLASAALMLQTRAGRCPFAGGTLPPYMREPAPFHPRSSTFLACTSVRSHHSCMTLTWQEGLDHHEKQGPWFCCPRLQLHEKMTGAYSYLFCLALNFIQACLAGLISHYVCVRFFLQRIV